MAFEFNEEDEPVGKIIAAEDMYKNDDGDLVPPGQDARVLVAKAGRLIPPGYEKGVTPGGKIKKSKPKAANKKRKAGDDK